MPNKFATASSIVLAIETVFQEEAPLPKPYPYPAKRHSMMPQEIGRARYPIYFVNRSDESCTVEYTTGGWCSDDWGIIQTNTSTNRIDLDSRSAVKIEEADEETFDYTFWYDVRITDSRGATHCAVFGVGRFGAGSLDRNEHDPVLNKVVRVISGRVG